MQISHDQTTPKVDDQSQPQNEDHLVLKAEEKEEMKSND